MDSHEDRLAEWARDREDGYDGEEAIERLARELARMLAEEEATT